MSYHVNILCFYYYLLKSLEGKPFLSNDLRLFILSITKSKYKSQCISLLRHSAPDHQTYNILRRSTLLEPSQRCSILHLTLTFYTFSSHLELIHNNNKKSNRVLTLQQRKNLTNCHNHTSNHNDTCT